MNLAIRNLRISYAGRTVVDVEQLDVGSSEIVGVAGESGSGKSSMATAILGQIESQGGAVTGSISLDDLELVGLAERELREVRGKRVAMIFQNPIASFNPTFRIGDIFHRALRLHGASRSEAQERASRAMSDVLLSDSLLRRYPHQLSGGQAQRCAIALAMALDVELLVADEPTSALDVTVQSGIIDILIRSRDEHGVSILIISHDLAVLGTLCDRVAVMHDGRIVEQGPPASVLRTPRAPYTKELIASIPTLTDSPPLEQSHA